MLLVRLAAVLSFIAGGLSAATLGSSFTITGGASDLDLDEARGRIYLIRPAPYSQIDVYSISQRRTLSSIKTDTNPLTGAFSRDKKYLYVVCNDAAVLDIIDLDAAAVINRIFLPAKPEAVATGADGRVLIVTQGSGAGNASNVLLLYDPAATDSPALQAITTTPPAPTPPQLPPPAGRTFLAVRSQLVATRTGNLIIGLNSPNATTRTVFVYDVASATVLRSRSVGDISNVFSVSPDGSRFMAGLTLFETSTLTVLAQQNAANAPFPFSVTETTAGFTAVAAQFRLQQNQGGSVFSPDGTILYSAFDIAPVTATRANVTQLLVNDPDNLLIRTALQLPENLSGKMEISADGRNIYALSESGFLTIPIGAASQSPLISPDSTAVLLANDVCGVTGAQRTATVNVRNLGAGRATITATMLAGALIGPGTAASVAPLVTTQNTATGAQVSLTFNTTNTRANGTLSGHDYLLNAAEAVNIAPVIRVRQNYRDPETRGEILSVPTNVSPDEGLVDMAFDAQRQRIYIANSGLNQVEVFDVKTRTLLTPIKVGQLPRALALAPSGSPLYVANSGSEYISVVDPDLSTEVSRLRMPPIPLNASYAIITPRILAATERGLLAMISNGTTGTLWSLIGDALVPRAQSTIIGTTSFTAPFSIASTIGGEYAVLLNGNGFVYLYDAAVDDFVTGRQVFTNPIQGYFGPIAAGPRGAYYAVNGALLNGSLVTVATATSGGGVIRPGTGDAAPTPISGLYATSAGQYARFVQPVLASATTLPTTNPTVEIVDAATGTVRGTASPALEGLLAVQTGTTRVNFNGHTLALDTAGTTAYALTASGLSIIPLDSVSQANRPTISGGGLLNFASRIAAITANNTLLISGRNLGQTASAPDPPYPTSLGGLCVTINNAPVPLLATSDTQVTAHVPSTLGTGRYAVVIHSLDARLASASSNITLARYAPAVLVDTATGLAAIYHAEDGRQVRPDYPAHRDEQLLLYATGLGATKGGRLPDGDVTPDSPDLLTDSVSVYFDNPLIKESAIIVESSRLLPGLVGVYEVRLRVPGTRRRGDALLVTVKVGGVSSPQSGSVVPHVAVE